ncbi:hypothetical protein GCM10009541_60900 [Micromonospora gifhornensis]|uniref:Uncharacterized protein n=1 Tax=Micromonospora gifhornensis TaxID=84594 RepID=A0ABQ4IL62_9ACTN|nr:hypothetical protein Vgi01_53270 [Micromonospora gifhornensis]
MAARATNPGSQLRKAGLSGVKSMVTPDTLPLGHDIVLRISAAVSGTTESGAVPGTPLLSAGRHAGAEGPERQQPLSGRLA